MKKTVTVFLLCALLLSGCGGSLFGPAPTPTPAATPEPTATPEPVWAEDMPFVLTWGGDAYEGAYTGALKSGLPSPARTPPGRP